MKPLLMSEVIRKNIKLNCASWFNRANQETYKETLPRYAYDIKGATYFVDLGVGWRGLKGFTIRKQNPVTGQVTTWSKPQEFQSYGLAIEWLAKFEKGE